MAKLFIEPFLKSQKWVYIWINGLKFQQFVFVVWKVEGYQIHVN